jgi:hypothetical protein
MTLTADDEMVVHGYAERAGGGNDLVGHVDVRAGGRGVARGVVVHEDNGAS